MLNPACKELYLADDEFGRIFKDRHGNGMTKDEFWKQVRSEGEQRRSNGLWQRCCPRCPLPRQPRARTRALPHTLVTRAPLAQRPRSPGSVALVALSRSSSAALRWRQPFWKQRDAKKRAGLF